MLSGIQRVSAIGLLYLVRFPMLVVTFHGGSGGITNVYAYDTTSGSLQTQTALEKAPPGDAELRGMICTNSYLYVVDGGKSGSNVLCYQLPASSSYTFTYVGEFLSPSLSKKKFNDSIGHPYAMVFDGAGNCYVSNQDTNVVARAQVASNFQSATIQQGCQSGYLNGITSFCPKSGCVYLDGTFVASQIGLLPDVAVEATSVPPQFGGLDVTFSNGTETAGHSKDNKVQNSVRDVAIWEGVLLVCDEPAKLIRLYSLTDGTYLGMIAVSAKPAHLAIFSSGLYVSAGNQLYWSPLNGPPDPTSLTFTSVLTAPQVTDPFDVGGVTFDTSSNTAYVAFQQGKGTTGSGAIYSYRVTPGSKPTSPPVFTDATVFATISTDTPEFVLFLA
jgi:hypothetical protein